MCKIDWNDKEKIEMAVKTSYSYAETLRFLGISHRGGNNKTLKKYIKKFNISITHFNPNYYKISHMGEDSTIPLYEILDGKHPQYQTTKLKSRLLKEGLVENICDECGQCDTWNDKPLVIQLDHIDGNSMNHKKDNLQMLCPNCHTQTTTYAGRKNQTKVKKYKDRDDYMATRKENYIISQQKYVHDVLTSGINFDSIGWVAKVAQIINQKPQKVGNWMNTMMPEFYKNCYKRKYICKHHL